MMWMNNENKLHIIVNACARRLGSRAGRLSGIGLKTGVRHLGGSGSQAVFAAPPSDGGAVPNLGRGGGGCGSVSACSKCFSAGSRGGLHHNTQHTKVDENPVEKNLLSLVFRGPRSGQPWKASSWPLLPTMHAAWPGTSSLGAPERKTEKRRGPQTEKRETALRGLTLLSLVASLSLFVVFFPLSLFSLSLSPSLPLSLSPSLPLSLSPSLPLSLSPSLPLSLSPSLPLFLERSSRSRCACSALHSLFEAMGATDTSVDESALASDVASVLSRKRSEFSLESSEKALATFVWGLAQDCRSGA